jgi:phage gpG-like protein
MDLAQAALRFAAAAVAAKAAEAEALETAAQLVETRAKNLIGVPKPEWPPLKPETLARKGGINTPLLETGELRESIQHVVIAPSAFVGSDEDRAVWQELGTSRGIPPRSFLGLAAQQKGDEVAKVIEGTIGAAISATLGGRSVEAEIARFLVHVAHETKERVEEIFAPPDEEEQRR